MPIVFAMRYYLLMRKSDAQDSRFGRILPAAYGRLDKRLRERRRPAPPVLAYALRR
jgi:hypothetical protein